MPSPSLMRPPSAICPTASAALAYHIESHDRALFAIGCRAWSCPVCGVVKRQQLIARIQKARPNVFITLSVRHEKGPDYQEKRLRDTFPRLIEWIRRNLELSIEYVRMHEECADGYPHFHLLARASYIPQDKLSTAWERFNGARIVDIRKAHHESTSYIAKYITKARTSDGEWSRQRISVSKNFWQTEEEQETEWLAWSNKLHRLWIEAERLSENNSFERKSPGVWWLRERYAGSDVPTEIAQM